jgi:hypothetical protein
MRPISAAVEAGPVTTSQNSVDASTPQTETASDVVVPAPPAAPEGSARIAAQELPPSPESAKPARTGKRKKPRQDSQMDLFGSDPIRADSTAGSALNTAPEQEASKAEEPTDNPPVLAPSPREEAVEADAKTTAPPPTESKPQFDPNGPRRPRRLPAPPPMNPAVLRKAANQILPLFAGKDPGAWDCLKANRDAFRSAFEPEEYLHFEQMVKKSDFESALDQLKKAARKHGVTL